VIISSFFLAWGFPDTRVVHSIDWYVRFWVRGWEIYAMQ
jgi:hypothetical protein